MNFLGIRVDSVDKDGFDEKIRSFLRGEKQVKIFTPNPEMLIDAQKDEYFKKVLNSGDLNLCDGRGIELFAKGKLKRFAGTDAMTEIAKIASLEKSGVFLLGSGSEEVIKKTAENLKKNIPDLSVAGFDKGHGIVMEDFKIKKTEKYQEDNRKILKEINKSKADILFVAFGHGKQEKWIYENLKSLPKVRIVMGVGGAFDYISGKVKRAPKWARKIGLEWFYRLLKQPSRIKRICKATLLFPLIVIKYGISSDKNI